MPWGTWAQTPRVPVRRPLVGVMHSSPITGSRYLSPIPMVKIYDPEPPCCWVQDVSGSFLNTIIFSCSDELVPGWYRSLMNP